MFGYLHPVNHTRTQVVARISKMLLQIFAVFALTAVHVMCDDNYEYKDGIHYKTTDQKTSSQKNKFLTKIFNQMDKNKDDNLVQDEMIEFFMDGFIKMSRMDSDWEWKRINTDNDEFITWNEICLERFKGRGSKALEEAIEKGTATAVERMIFTYEKNKFEIVDKNKDNKLSPNEHFYFLNSNSFLPRYELYNMWKDYDKNGDGKAEFEEMHNPEYRMEDQTVEEHKESDRGFFNSRDMNHDGILDFDEVREMIHPNREEQAKQHIKYVMEKIDTNNDNKLSRKEFEKGHEEMSMFDGVDVRIPRERDDDVKGPPIEPDVDLPLFKTSEKKDEL